VVKYAVASTGAALAFISVVFGLRFAAVFSNAFSENKSG
jgi:hypothetical protein